MTLTLWRRAKTTSMQTSPWSSRRIRRDKYKQVNKFIIGPNVAKLFVTNETSRETWQGEQGRRVWLTISQVDLEGPMYFNSKEDAHEVAESRSMSSSRKRSRRR